MKFDSTPRFDSDWKSLPAEHKKLFRTLLPAFNAACEGYDSNPGAFVRPANLRTTPMVSAKGIWEMTWSFKGPDGRATFEFVAIDGETAVRWRRIGRHGVFNQP
ncbi:hypothetical protein ACWKSP_34275 [Micromonosporaceae bacterium Da 78-11]